MSGRMDMDGLLREIGKEQAGKGTSPFVPDFDRLAAQAGAEYGRRRRKKTVALALRCAGICLAAVVVVNGALLFAETAPARAYRETVRVLYFNLVNGGQEQPPEQQSTDLATIQEKVPFTIPQPRWLPEGFVFQQATLQESGDGELYFVTMKYRNGDDALHIYVSNDTMFSQTKPSPDEPPMEEVGIGGAPVYLREGDPEKGSHTQAIFYDKHGLFITVSGVVDRQQMVKIVEGLLD